LYQNRLSPAHESPEEEKGNRKSFEGWQWDRKRFRRSEKRSRKLETSLQAEFLKLLKAGREKRKKLFWRGVVVEDEDRVRRDG